MSLPAGTHFIPAGRTYSGDTLTAWANTTGTHAATPAAGTWTRTTFAGQSLVAPSAAGEMTVPGAGVGGTGGGWGVYWAGRRSQLSGLHHLICGRSAGADQAWGLNWSSTGYLVSQRAAAGYENLSGPEATSVDEIVLVSGGYDPATGLYYFGHSSHPDTTAVAGAAYNYGAAPLLTVGGRADGWGVQAAGCLAFGFRTSRFTQAERVQLLAELGLPDPRTTHYGAAGVAGRQQTLLGGTLTTTIREIDSAAAEILTTREGGTAPVAYTVLVDGFADPASAGTREWAADGWRQSVHRTSLTHLSTGIHRLDAAGHVPAGGTKWRVEGLTWQKTGTHAPVLVPRNPDVRYGPVCHPDRTTRGGRLTYDAARSELLFGTFIFGPENTNPDKYGTGLRDQLVAAKLYPEIGIPVVWDENGGAGYASADQAWASWASLRATYETTYFATWGDRPVFWSGDNLTWKFFDPDDSYRWVFMRRAHDLGWMADLTGRIRGWLHGGTVGDPKAVVLRDEVELFFGADPTNLANPATGPDGLNGSAGVREFISTWKSGGGCLVGYNHFGVGELTPPEYSGWMEDEYCTFRQVEGDSHLVSTPPFSPLSSFYRTHGWAARQRDPAKPFALLLSTVTETGPSLGGGVVNPDHPIYLQGGAYTPFAVTGQVWVNLGYGATVQRVYFPESFDVKAASEAAPAGQGLQRAIHPGHPAWDRMLLAITAAHEYAPYILQEAVAPPVEVPREWFYWCREGQGRRLAVLVNVSWAAQPFPANVPAAAYARAEVLTTTRTAVSPTTLPGRPVPAGGVVLLTDTPPARPFAPPPRRSRVSYAPGEPYSTTLLTTDPATGAVAAPDAAPAVALHRNGAATATPVTVTPAGTGWYKVAFTFPADWAAGDAWATVAAYRVGGVAAGGVDDRGVLGSPLPAPTPCPDTDGWASTVNCQLSNVSAALTALADRLKGS